MEHIRNRIGADHIGIGSDYDGIVKLVQTEVQPEKYLGESIWNTIENLFLDLFLLFISHIFAFLNIRWLQLGGKHTIVTHSIKESQHSIGR